MQTTISNSTISATIKHSGAELSSLKNKDGVEFMWQADAAVWARHSPVLFPVVGRLKNDSYMVNGETFKMKRHGFARDKMFVVAMKEETGLLLKLVADDETKSMYPFDFDLLMHYFLIENKVTVSYMVKNYGTSEMPFSIGAHPAFKCPILADETLEDYYLEFEKDELLETTFLLDGNFTDEKKLILNNEKIIPLTKSTFNRDALVFENFKSDWLMLRSKKSDRAVKVSIKGFPYLGNWSMPGAAFVCIEPWHGLADHVQHNGDIFSKRGIRILKPGESFMCSFSIEVF